MAFIARELHCVAAHDESIIQIHFLAIRLDVIFPAIGDHGAQPALACHVFVLLVAFDATPILHAGHLSTAY